jgi:hypothetical protein
MMTRPAWLSTFLFAAALSPVLLQADTCIAVGNARLDVLELWVPNLQGESVIEGFDPDVLRYDAYLLESEVTAVLFVQAQNPTATMEVQHDSQVMPLISDAYAVVHVPMGNSELHIKVSVDTGGVSPYSWTYVVNIERGGEGILSIDIDVEVGAGGAEGGAP